MEVLELDFSGCYLLKPKILKDSRGSFVKTYQQSKFTSFGLNMEFKEEYYSVSKKGVVRGMHFQMPPYAHSKMVYCLKGSVFDAFVDLRKGSQTYLQTRHIHLSEGNGYVLILAKGIAHGFCSLEDESMMVYKTTTEYKHEYDTGILWDSCNIDWPSIANPQLLSDRDKTLITLKKFDSPFASRIK